MGRGSESGGEGVGGLGGCLVGGAGGWKWLGEVWPKEGGRWAPPERALEQTRGRMSVKRSWQTRSCGAEDERRVLLGIHGHERGIAIERGMISFLELES